MFSSQSPVRSHTFMVIVYVVASMRLYGPSMVFTMPSMIDASFVAALMSVGVLAAHVVSAHFSSEVTVTVPVMGLLSVSVTVP